MTLQGVFRRLALVALCTLVGPGARAETDDEIGAGGASTRAALEKRCGGGDMRACSNLGVFFERGLGGEQSDARAAELFLRACNQKEATGCFNLGTRYQKGRGVARDWEKAAGFFAASCERGHASACSAEADLYDQGGHGLAQDPARSAALYGTACEAGFAAGCFNLGTSYQAGAGVKKDPARALALYEKACYAKPAAFPPGCNNSGHMLLRGDGVEKDVAKGAANLARMCSLAAEPGRDQGTRRAGVVACMTAAPLFERGEGVPQKKDGARELYQSACNLGDQGGCEAAARLR